MRMPCLQGAGSLGKTGPAGHEHRMREDLSLFRALVSPAPRIVSGTTEMFKRYFVMNFPKDRVSKQKI